MSMSLKMQPVVERSPVRLCGTMKRIIGERFWDNDGSLGGPKLQITWCDSHDIAFFEGLIAAGSGEVSRDAKAILDSIAKHGTIELFVAE